MHVDLLMGYGLPGNHHAQCDELRVDHNRSASHDRCQSGAGRKRGTRDNRQPPAAPMSNPMAIIRDEPRCCQWPSLLFNEVRPRYESTWASVWRQAEGPAGNAIPQATKARGMSMAIT